MTIVGACWLIGDHNHTSGTNSKTMSVSSANLTDLPVETLEQILLNLPGADIVKIEVVECFVATPYDSAFNRSLPPVRSRLVDNSGI